MSNQTDIASAALTRTALLVKEAVFPELAEREIVRALTRTRVRLSADEETLASQAGQTALVSAFVSVAQLGAHIFVNIPETGLIHPQPPIVGEELLSGLLEHSQDLIAPAASDHVTPVDLEIVFGAATPQLDVSKHPVLLSCGDDWSTSLTPLADSKPHPWAGRYPIGAMFAGVAIGAEVFRVVLTALAEENGLASAGGLYLGGAKPLRVGLPPLQLPSVINLGAIDFVSAGAITNAALFTLLRVPGLRARIRVIDDDILRLENLKSLSARSALAGRTDQSSSACLFQHARNWHHAGCKAV